MDFSLSIIFFALSDRTRLSIVERLSADSDLSATFLANGSEVTRQNIVKHLRVLEAAGLIARKKRGREVLYKLERVQVKEAQQFLSSISAGWDQAIDRLQNTVEDVDMKQKRKESDSS